MALSPRESGKLIAGLAEHVKIQQKGIENLGNELTNSINTGELSLETFSQSSVHPRADDPWALDWLFVVDTLNFCFWSMDDEEGWTVEGKTGYFALCTAINRAMRENIDILNPKYYATITEDQLKKTLRSDNEVQIPLLNERVKSLHEVGAALLENFEGTFVSCVKRADNSAVKLLHLILDNFKCFRDETVYKNHNVSLYKRAQILVGDIWACYKNRGLGYFKDIDEITMFADYRVPQSLLFYGVFTYSDALTAKLRSNAILQNGDEMEVEIRGCSIHAVELLKEFVQKRVDKSKEVNAVVIDHFLWDFRRKNARNIEEMGLPFHKTFCIYY